jgi:uncharacterized protein YcaQ
VLWSRLGDYQPRWLEDLLEEGALFEYWSRAASFLPILYNNALIGRIDPKAHRKDGIFEVKALHLERAPSSMMPWSLRSNLPYKPWPRGTRHHRSSSGMLQNPDSPNVFPINWRRSQLSQQMKG